MLNVDKKCIRKKKINKISSSFAVHNMNSIHYIHLSPFKPINWRFNGFCVILHMIARIFVVVATNPDSNCWLLTQYVGQCKISRMEWFVNIVKICSLKISVMVVVVCKWKRLYDLLNNSNDECREPRTKKRRNIRNTVYAP